MSKLFTDNFPDVKTSAELELQKRFYLKKQYDLYYIVSGCSIERREKFEKLWQVYEPYADKHFLKQVKLDFHARTWEMYLGNIFLQNKLAINSSNHGPDIKLRDSNSSIWIEAVVAKKGVGSDSVPELNYGSIQGVPEDQMIMRLTQCLASKFKQYQDYIKKDIVKPNEPFIIAINRGALEYPELEIPLIMKCLFALGSLTLPVPIGGSPGEAYMARRENIIKQSGNPVPLNFFENTNHIGISAVIYSNNTVLNHPQKLGEDCILIHNPLAKNPINLNKFNFLKQRYIKENRIVSV